MTDRVNGLYVTLDRDYRDDDVEAILCAIRMIKGVLNVDSNIVSVDDHFVKTRLTQEFKNKLYTFINDELK